MDIAKKHEVIDELIQECREKAARPSDTEKKPSTFAQLPEAAAL
jgi:hypothetical protein